MLTDSNSPDQDPLDNAPGGTPSVPKTDRGAVGGGVARSIWALGFVSLFMDMSSEIVHGLLPLFLTVTLGASLTTLGLLEGLAEGCVLLFKTLSGPLSDRLGRRKPLALLGYSMGALSKPIFALAPTVGIAFGARLFDRIGKGIRGAPRDALVADLSEKKTRGRAYGLRQSLDAVGSVAGPLLAAGLMVAFDEDIRLVFWCAAIPAAFSVWVLLRSVQETPRPVPQRPLVSWDSLRLFEARTLRCFPRGFWVVVAAGFLFQLARFSEAFLILRASDLGLSLAFAPLVLVVMNLFYGLSAYPAGRLSDRMDRDKLLMGGMVLLIAADLVFAWGETMLAAGIGCALWGLHMGLSQGILAALVADTSPSDLRGTAFGLLNLFSAFALLMASLLAGVLWDRLGPTPAFLGGAALATISLSLLVRSRLTGYRLMRL